MSRKTPLYVCAFCDSDYDCHEEGDIRVWDDSYICHGCYYEEQQHSKRMPEWDDLPRIETEEGQLRAELAECQRERDALWGASEEAIPLLRHIAGANCTCDHTVGQFLCESCDAYRIISAIEAAKGEQKR